MVFLTTPSGVDPADSAYVVNPVTGERFMFHSPADPDTEPLEADIWAPPGMSPLVEHVHPRQVESFEIQAGAMSLSLDGVVKTLTEGEEATIPAGTPHSWWPTGDEELHVRARVDPALQSEDILRDLTALARRGRVKANGAPSMLQLATLHSAYGFDEIYITKAPLPVQKALFGLLAPIAKTLGYRANPVPGREN